MNKITLTWASVLLLVSYGCALPQHEPDQHKQESYGTQQDNVTVGGGQTQSPLCQVAFDCVPWQTCIDGTISTSGDFQIDLRFGNSAPPAGTAYTLCGQTGNVCCGIPKEFLGPVYEKCSDKHKCVEKKTCNLYTGYIEKQVHEWDGQPFLNYSLCKTDGISEGVCCKERPKNYVVTEKPTSGPTVHQPSGNEGHSPNENESGGSYPDGPSGSIIAQCGLGYDCVPYFQCQNGTINTDGTHLIDIRLKQPSICTNPDYKDVSGVCCKIPGYEPPVTPAVEPKPLHTCPGYLECVDAEQCGSDGSVNTDGTGLIDLRNDINKKCYWTTGLVGVCCQPQVKQVNIIPVCPKDSVCIAESSCSGQILDSYKNVVPYATGGVWLQCSYNSDYQPGVCCVNTTKPTPVPDVYDCPKHFVCIPGELCFGNAVDSQGSQVSYSSELSWTQCTIIGGDYATGICCANPPPPTTTTPYTTITPSTTPYTTITPSTSYSTTPIVDSTPHDNITVATYCGVSKPAAAIDTRIQTDSKPNEADFGEFPWQAIIFYSNFTFKCGASLIQNRFLLTAAHCVDGLKPYDIRIRFGEWQVNSFDERFPYEDAEVTKITVHQEFRAASAWNDIAVIELKSPVVFKYHINSICLPTSGQVFPEGTRCFASGWGKDSFTGNYQHILKKIDLPVVENYRCQDLLRKTRLGKYFLLHKSFMCAGGEENRDACRGDGGGPLACKVSDTGRYVLTGITAWGIDCGTKDVPGVYVDVQQFSGWIQSIIDLSNPQQQSPSLEAESDKQGYERK